MLEITTVNGTKWTIEGEYVFAHGCYIINGESYPQEIVTVIR